MPSLEELLVQTKLISPPQLAVAEHDAKTRRKRLAPALIDLGFVSDRRLAEWMAEQTKLPIVDPGKNPTFGRALTSAGNAKASVKSAATG